MSGESPSGGWPPGFAAGPRNRRALLVLTALRGLSPRKLLELAQREGSADACLVRVIAGRAGSDADTEFARRADAGALTAALDACGARVIAAEDPEYPPGLNNLADPPAALFARGRSMSPHDFRVSVVGARSCSALGREVAKDIGAGLARAGVVVVSGAARGIDTAAHEGGLAGTSDGAGSTLAVLGSGIDVDYPRSNSAMFRRIAVEGTVLSEYAPGVPAEPFRFPARNRIIAGLARAVVIVEGADGSGSLITAEHALDLGRDVYALPGAVNNPLARAPLSIIREGALMIRGVQDLLGDLGLESDPRAALLAQLNLIEDAVLRSLEGPTLPDRVARDLGCEIGDVMGVLLSLEMKGLVRSLGGRFEQTNLAAASS